MSTMNASATAQRPSVAKPAAKAPRRRTGHGATVLVAALASAFGTGILAVIDLVATTVAADPIWGQEQSVRMVLTIVSTVFIAIAVYVAAIVTVNTVATIVAGRTRELALARLLGATAASRRALLAREGLVAGTIGGIIGMLAALGLVWGGTRIAVGTGLLPDLAYAPFSPLALGLMVIIALTTWLSSWVGARRVLEVSPIAALGAAVPADTEAIRGRRGRRTFAIVMLAVGAALLGLGLVTGLVHPIGLLISFTGGIVSFTGVVAGSIFVIPPVLRAVGALFGRRPAAKIGAANAIRSPERSARASIGLVIGATLVTTLFVASATFERMLQIKSEAVFGSTEPVDGVLDQLMLIFGVLIGYSALIAAVGLVNALTVGVLQRTREFGLLRALGFSRGQVRGTVIAEAATMTITSLSLGLALGVGYGWVGANSLFAGELGHLHPPVVPWWLIVGVAAIGALLTFAASLVPAGRASRLSPVVALAAY